MLHIIDQYKVYDHRTSVKRIDNDCDKRRVKSIEEKTRFCMMQVEKYMQE